MIHDLSQIEQHRDYGRQMKRIGDDVSEQLSIIPQTHFFIHHDAVVMVVAVSSVSTQHSDETGMQVPHESGQIPQSQTWLWIRRGSPPDKTVVLVDYSPSRAGKIASSLLEDFHGYLVFDAYSGYRPVIKDNQLKSLYCNDHARRRFKEIVKSVGQRS